MKVLKYLGDSGRIIFFEPSENDQPLDEGLISAERYLNSIFLETGRLECYTFSLAYVFNSTEEEVKAYEKLKEESIYLKGKI